MLVFPASAASASPIIDEGDYYYIASVPDTNKVLDVKNGSKSNGANIQLYKKNGTNIWIYTGNGTKAQKFVLIPYVSRSYKTVKLEFHDLQSWMNAVTTAQRSITIGSSLVSNPSGNTYYNGKIIIGAEVLEYRQLTVKLPAQGPGAYTSKTINFPSVIRYKLHSHSSKVNWWFDFTQLRSWQSCTCGYHDEWTWEFPWPDTGDTQTTSKTIDAIRPVWQYQYNVH